MTTSDWHRLSNYTEDKLYADCSVCGRVRVHYKGDGKYVCSVKKRTSQYRREAMAKFGEEAGTARQSLFDEQGGKCAICGTEITVFAHLDHDHQSNQIRGLLCRHCNIGLGQFQDNVVSLNNAISYLSSSN